MATIDEELIESTCQEVAALDASGLSSAMEALGRRQPNLLAFVIATCEELAPEAAELGVYVFFVVYRTFERASGAVLERASQKRVLAAEEQNDLVLASMGNADAGFLVRVEELESSSQPVVVQYIVDVLAGYGEADEEENPLSSEEQWLLFYVLNTVVDVLDELAT